MTTNFKLATTITLLWRDNGHLNDIIPVERALSLIKRENASESDCLKTVLAYLWHNKHEIASIDTLDNILGAVVDERVDTRVDTKRTVPDNTAATIDPVCADRKVPSAEASTLTIFDFIKTEGDDEMTEFPDGSASGVSRLSGRFTSRCTSFKQ
jgi:hypothetical protein